MIMINYDNDDDDDDDDERASLRVDRDFELSDKSVSYTHLTLPTNREV